MIISTFPRCLCCLLWIMCALNLATSRVEEDTKYWKKLGREAIENALKDERNTGKAKNVILFVGDGMGISTITAGRIYNGQLDGKPGEEGYLSFEKFRNVGLLKSGGLHITPVICGPDFSDLSLTKIVRKFILPNCFASSTTAAAGPCSGALVFLILALTFLCLAYLFFFLSLIFQIQSQAFGIVTLFVLAASPIFFLVFPLILITPLTCGIFAFVFQVISLAVFM